MNWLRFLFVFTFTDAASIVRKQNSLDVNANKILQEAEFKYVRDQFQMLSEDFIKSFESAHSHNLTSRRKRQVASAQNSFLLSDSKGVEQIQSVKPLMSLCSPSLEIKFIDVNNVTYAACVTIPATNFPAVVYLGYIVVSGWYVLAQWTVSQPQDLAMFFDRGLLHILVADSANVKGIDLVKFNVTSHDLVFEHTVTAGCPTAVSIWKMKTDEQYHMAVANGGCLKENGAETSIYTYIWKGTYFDRYSIGLPAYDVTDIQPFHIQKSAFLAVANYRKGDNYFVDSEIFKYNLDKNAWQSFQRIRTYEAVDWEFFSLGEGTGEEVFLAVANYASYDPSVIIKSVIYKFVDDTFVSFQCLDTFGATAIASLKDESKFLLAVSNVDGVHMYQYDGWRFVRSKLQYTHLSMGSGVRAMSFHQLLMEEKKFVLGVSNVRPRYMSEPSVFELTFVGVNHLQPWYEKNTEWCMDKYESFRESRTEMALDFKNSFFVDQAEPIVINGDIYFNNGIEASRLITPKIRDSHQKVYDNTYLESLGELNNRIQNVRNRIDMLNHILSKSLKTYGNQEINATYEFRDVGFLCESYTCHFERITTSILNGEDITNLKDNVILVDQDLVINDLLSSESITAGNMNVHGLVDGVDFETVLTTSGNHTITGFKEFTKLIVADDLEVHGLVDNVRFSADSILLTNGFQNVTGNIFFKNVNTKWLDVRGLVNGIDLTKFYNDVVLSDGMYYITGKKTFGDLYAQNWQINSGSTVNGIDLQQSWMNTLWKQGFQVINAPLSFTSLSLEKNLIVEGKINGLDIPGSQVLFVDQNAEVTAPQVFDEMATTRAFYVRGSLNGITVNPETGELDILTKDGQQTVTGLKTFRTIVIDNHSFVDGTVNGVDFSEFHDNSIHNDIPIKVSKPWQFKNLVVEGPLIVGGSLTSVNIANVYNDALKLNDTDISYFDSFVFESPVSIQEFTSDNINGISVSRDLVSSVNPQVINGVKTFHNIILEDDSNVSGKVNDIDLSFLKDTILRIGDQRVTSDKIIHGNLNVNRLTVKGFVNGVNINELLTLHDGDIITGLKTLSNVTFDKLSVGDVQTYGLVNGIALVELMSDTMTYNGAQTVMGRKNLNGLLHLENYSDLITNDLNGINLSELYKDVVFSDEEQLIGGIKSFVAPVTFDHIAVEGSVDGVNPWDMKHNWMLQGLNQTVTGNVRFKDITSKDIVVEGYINGIDIAKLNEDIVKVNEETIIQGPIVFEHSVVSNNDVSLTGRIQGIDLSEEAAVRTKENVIFGRKLFVSDLIIDSDLIVNGLVDGVNISSFCENVVLLHEKQDIQSLVVKGNVVLKKGGSVGGTVAGVDVNSLYENAVSSLNPETFVNGLKSFQSLTIEGNLNIAGTFGGVDIEDLARSYMSLSRFQNVHASHRFEQLYINGALHARNLYTSNQNIGVDIPDLNRRTLKTVGQQVVNAEYKFSEIIFEDDVIVVGKVNGIEIPKGLMQRNRTNYVKSPKVFAQSVRVLGDLDIAEGKTIQGVDVSAWLEDAVKNNGGKYEIKGRKTFSTVSANDIIVNGLIDGVKISEEELLLTYGDQTVSAQKVIQNKVDIHDKLTVNGLINNVNLDALVTRAVKTDGNSTITAMKTFSSQLTVRNLNAELVDGVDLEELQKLINADTTYGVQERKLGAMEYIISDLKSACDGKAVLLQYYDLFQAFEIPEAFSWLYVPTYDREFLLLSDFTMKTGGCTSIRIFEYNAITRTFHLKEQELTSAYSKSMKILEAWGATFVMIANSKANSCYNRNASVELTDDIGEAASSIYYFHDTSNAFLPYQNFQTLPIVDVVTFSEGPLACLVFVEVYDTVVYCAKDMFHDFVWHEKLPTTGGRKAALTRSDDKIILAVASVDTMHPNYPQFVDIYIWDRSSKSFGGPIQVKETAHVQSVMLVSHSRFNYTETFLFITEGTVPRINNAPRLSIYKFYQGHFQKYQEIVDSGELDWTVSPSGHLMLFALNSRTGQINIYVYRGASGFTKFDSIKSEGAITMHVFKRSDPEDSMSHYLALAGFQSHLSNVWMDPDNAKILKSKMKGKKYSKSY